MNWIFESAIKLSFRFILATLFGISTLFSISCNDDDDNESLPAVVDEYYIRYEASASTSRFGDLDVIIATETSPSLSINITKPSSWETIIGPVSKGFNARIRVTNPGLVDGQLVLNAAIYVSKNNGPFALKRFDNSRNVRQNMQIEYLVNF